MVHAAKTAKQTQSGKLTFTTFTGNIQVLSLQ